MESIRLRNAQCFISDVIQTRLGFGPRCLAPLTQTGGVAPFLDECGGSKERKQMLVKSPQDGWWNVIKMPSDSSCCRTSAAFERALSMFRCVCAGADGTPQKTGLRSHRGGTTDRFLVPPLPDQCFKPAVDLTLLDVRRAPAQLSHDAGSDCK